MENLPKETWSHILKYLSPPDVCSLSQTCHWMNALCNDEYLWKTKALQYDFISGEDIEWLRTKKHMSYKQIVKFHIITEKNWSEARYEVTDLNGHENIVLTTVFDISEDVLYSGSINGDIFIWDLALKRIVKKINAHSAGVSSLSLDSQLLYSSSWDHTIKLWCRKTHVCCHTLDHTTPVICIHHDKNRNLIFSGTQSGELYCWNIRDFQLLFSLNHPHQQMPTCCIDVNDQWVVSGAGNFIWIWDLTLKELAAVVKGHDQAVTGVCLYQDKLICCSEDKKISIRSGNLFHQCDAILRGHRSGVRCMAVRNDKLVTGSYDNSIRIWCLISLVCITCLDGHHGDVNCVSVSNHCIISGSDDFKIKIWHFSKDMSKPKRRISLLDAAQ
eukprot:Sdes_comp19140_c0_seq1m9874